MFGSPYFAGVMFGQNAVAAFAFLLDTDVILITVDRYSRIVMVDAYSRAVIIDGHRVIAIDGYSRTVTVDGHRSIYVPDVREDL